MRENLFGAGNQQGTQHPLIKGCWDASETTSRSPSTAELKAYLQGAIHDGTYSHLHKTTRISQKGKVWLGRLRRMFVSLGYRSWLYREGKMRTVYILETTAPFLSFTFDPLTLQTAQERMAYIRGYFDAEGGIPHSKSARFYIQLCQKNRREMEAVRTMLECMGINCGIVHNPSSTVDPDYWRFYVRSRSHQDFISAIGSWHPKKQRILQERMKI